MNNDFVKFLNGGYKGISQIRCKFPSEVDNIIKFNKKFNINHWGQMLFNYLNNISELPKCKCGNSLKFIKFKKGYAVFCSIKCMSSDVGVREKVKETFLKKYGVQNPLQSPEVQEKRKKNFIEKYGVEHQSQLISVCEKRKKTCLDKFGATTNLLCDDTINKIKQTNLRIFGCEHNSQSQQIKEKKKKTNLRNCGFEYNFQSEISKEKVKKTNLKKYGVECTLLSEDVKEKIKSTNLKKYGVVNPNSCDVIKEKRKNTFLKKYGVEYPSQNKEISLRIISTTIEKYGEIWFNNVPSYNPNSIAYLDQISELLNIKIQHALNGGEKKFVKYWVDGYIEEHNICIEWDENHHYNVKNVKSDIIRENYIKENFGCHIIRINESKFLLDVNNQIIIIVNLINHIINNGKSSIT